LVDFNTFSAADFCLYVNSLPDDHVVRKEYLQLDQEIEKFCDTHDHTGMLGFDECIDKVGYEEVMNFIGKLQKNLHYK
jgi:hypothetical protein